jgi:hypothetical protein
MSKALHKLVDAFSLKTKSGTASPQRALVYETPAVPLADVMQLYERDPTCKASVDLLAASAVGTGFYTTVNEDYEKAAEAKRVVDSFNQTVNLDSLLCDMAREETAFLSAQSDADSPTQQSHASASAKSSGGPPQNSPGSQPAPSTSSPSSSTR